MEINPSRLNYGSFLGDTQNIATTELGNLIDSMIESIPNASAIEGINGLFSYIIQTCGVSTISPVYQSLIQDVQTVNDCVNNTTSSLLSTLNDMKVQLNNLPPISYASYCQALSNQIPNLVLNNLSTAATCGGLANFTQDYNLISQAGVMCQVLSFCFPQEISGSLANDFSQLAFLAQQVTPASNLTQSSPLGQQILSIINVINTQLQNQHWFVS